MGHHQHNNEHDDGNVQVHIHPTRFYLKIFGALIAMTVITVATSYINLDKILFGFDTHNGALNLSLAMLIASIKAGLVVTFFMHLKDDSRFNALIFVGSLLFVGIFLAYTINDLGYRGLYDPHNGVQVDPQTGKRAPGGITKQFVGQEPLEGVELLPEDQVLPHSVEGHDNAAKAVTGHEAKHE